MKISADDKNFNQTATRATVSFPSWWSACCMAFTDAGLREPLFGEARDAFDSDRTPDMFCAVAVGTSDWNNRRTGALPPDAKLEAAKATAAFLASALRVSLSRLEQCDTAVTVNELVGTIYAEEKTLQDIAEDIRSMIRSARR